MDTPESVLATIARITKREQRLIASYWGEGVSMEAEGEQLIALVDTARALDAASIAYALIGGLAVGVHSRTPRATLDVDVAALVSAGRANVVAALEGAGFRMTGEFAHSVNFRHASGQPVQVAFDDAFDPMILRAERIEVGDVTVCIVTRQDLVAMKERAAADPKRRHSKRLQDQVDIARLRGDVADPDEGW